MLIVSIFTTQWMRDLIFDEPFRDRGPFRAVERIIENMNPADRVQGLRDLQSRPRPPRGAMNELDDMTERRGPPPVDFGEREGNRPAGDREDDRSPMGSVPSPFFDFVLLDQTGAILFPVKISDSRHAHLRALIEKLKDQPKEIELVSDQMIIRKLTGTPTQYLSRGIRYRPPPPPPKHFAILMSIQMLSTLFAVLLTLGAVLYTIRQRALQAEDVIAELGRGNLKARIPISKMDEIGTVMFSFNKMADEIEHLIEHLRKTEHARRDLLRELAHDLRTPVASLKSLIETVNERADQLPREKRRELLDLAMREAEYFEGLVDDLLFLGRVQEPKYKTTTQTIDVREMIRLEIEPIQHRHPTIDVRLMGADVSFDGDAGQLKRLVRNAIENAVSFARTRVEVELRVNERWVEIEIRDDGPGFDPASLASFGQRKYSRAMVPGPHKRISIGLGSVIMKSIVDAYRGELHASNRLDDSSRDVLGARVSIRLPLS